MKLRASGDTLLLIEWDQIIDPDVNEQVIQLAEHLNRRIRHVIRDIVPAYSSIGIHFDPLHTDLQALQRVIQEESRKLFHAAAHGPPRRTVEIPVRYGGTDGPDLDSVANWAGCTPQDVIVRHTAPTYRVYMLGFVPGFSYLGRVDRTIAAPRHRVPRERVPAGSVGIAGEQTGVYPIESPGGWQLIGRTDVVMFDAARPESSLLHAGDLVKFAPVSA